MKSTGLIALALPFAIVASMAGNAMRNGSLSVGLLMTLVFTVVPVGVLLRQAWRRGRRGRRIVALADQLRLEDFGAGLNREFEWGDISKIMLVGPRGGSTVIIVPRHDHTIAIDDFFHTPAQAEAFVRFVRQRIVDAQPAGVEDPSPAPPDEST